MSSPHLQPLDTSEIRNNACIVILCHKRCGKSTLRRNLVNKLGSTDTFVIYSSNCERDNNGIIPPVLDSLLKERSDVHKIVVIENADYVVSNQWFQLLLEKRYVCNFSVIVCLQSLTSSLRKECIDYMFVKKSLKSTVLKNSLNEQLKRFYKNFFNIYIPSALQKLFETPYRWLVIDSQQHDTLHWFDSTFDDGNDLEYE